MIGCRQEMCYTLEAKYSIVVQALLVKALLGETRLRMLYGHKYVVMKVPTRKVLGKQAFFPCYPTL